MQGVGRLLSDVVVISAAILRLRVHQGKTSVAPLSAIKSIAYKPPCVWHYTPCIAPSIWAAIVIRAGAFAATRKLSRR
jgi:hypothetical protein